MAQNLLEDNLMNQELNNQKFNNQELMKHIKKCIKNNLDEKIRQIISNSCKKTNIIWSRKDLKHLINTIYRDWKCSFSVSLIDYIYTESEHVKYFQDMHNNRKKHRSLPRLDSIMLSACARNNTEVVKFILSKKMKKLYPFLNPSIRSNRLILQACSNGNIELVKFLLSDNDTMRLYDRIDINADDYGQKSVYDACLKGHTEVVKFLLSNEIIKLYPSIYPFRGLYQAVKTACLRSNTEILKCLLSSRLRRLNPKNFNPFEGRAGEEIIMNASTSQNLNIMKILFSEKITDFYPGLDPGYHNNIILRSACKSGNVDIFKFFFANSERFPSLDPTIDENVFIIEACYYNKIEIVKFLLSDDVMKMYPGIDPTAQDNAALISACKNGHVEIVKFLLEHPKFHIDPTTRDNEALILACKYGYIEVVRFLLSSAVMELHPTIDPSARNNEAILLACQNSCIEVVRFLLSEDVMKICKFIDPGIQNNIILISACEFGRTEIVEFLLSPDVMRLYPSIDPTAKNNKAIKKACLRYRTDIVKLMISKNVDPSVDNNEPLLIVCENGCENIVEILLKDQRVLDSKLDHIFHIVFNDRFRNKNIKSLMGQAKEKANKFILS